MMARLRSTVQPEGGSDGGRENGENAGVPPRSPSLCPGTEITGAS